MGDEFQKMDMNGKSFKLVSQWIQTIITNLSAPCWCTYTLNRTLTCTLSWVNSDSIVGDNGTCICRNFKLHCNRMAHKFYISLLYANYTTLDMKSVNNRTYVITLSHYFTSVQFTTIAIKLKPKARLSSTLMPIYIFLQL